MAVPAGFIAAIPDSASIPSGWERATELDDRHPKGAAAGADPGTQGGADTHTHTSPTHTHTVGSHQHTGGTSGASGNSSLTSSGAAGSRSLKGHTHTAGTSGLQTSNLIATAGSFGTANNDPPFYTVRWIRSLGTPSGIPSGAWCYWDAAALPSGWSSPAAVRTKYLKGATAGANGGSTGGSSSAHTHAGVAHTHVFEAHDHSGGASGAASATFSYTAGSDVTVATSTHTHVASFASTPSTTASGSATSASTGSTAGVVPYQTLGIIQNDTGAAAFPVGVIGLWLGTLASIPASLLLCDGTGGTQDTRGRYVIGADISAGSFTGIGTGSATTTHDHSDPAAHSHSASHQHDVNLAAASSATGTVATGALYAHDGSLHSHASFSSGSVGGTSGNGTETVDTATSDPQNITVAFVKYAGSITVTMTSPTDGATLTSSAVTASWTLSAGTQSTRRVRIYESDQSSLIYDSGTIASATQSYDIPSTAGLRNGRTYYLFVNVVNNSGTPGDSGMIGVTTAWTPPDTVTGLTLTPIGGS